MGILNQDKDNDELLLYREWVNANKSLEDKTQLVTSINLSRSEEWILIKTLESVALLKAESAIGADLWQNLKQFNGKAKALIIYPTKGKLGFDLDFHESKTAFYQWIDEELNIGKKPSTQKAGISGISWKKAQITSTPSLDTGNTLISTDEGVKPLEGSSGNQMKTSKRKMNPKENTSGEQSTEGLPFQEN